MMNRLNKAGLLMMVGLSNFSRTASGHNLMPVPRQIEWSCGRFAIDGSFSIAVLGSYHERLLRAVPRFQSRLSGRTGLFLTLPCGTASVDSSAMSIRVKRPGRVILGEDESYRLLITSQNVTLESETDIGALRGLETLLQLVDGDSSGWFLPTVVIDDKPRFPWRGLLLDVCRHFMPMDVIKRNLDGMAAVKMNVFHWHLTEDQGFRVECKTYPLLHQLGSDGQYYTQEQIREIIAYADDRGIRVVPEFDIPGHTTSWLVGYPELASLPGPYRIERTWGVFENALDPTSGKTERFLKRFFKEMADLFPDDYIHIGGDEVNPAAWEKNPKILEYMKKNSIPDMPSLQNRFNIKIAEILADEGKTVVGWDEILHPDMPQNIVIQSWRGRDAMIEAARQGHRTLLSNGYYIDLCQNASRHYLNDPMPDDTLLTDDQKSYILGGEATMWAELANSETVDSRIWPRTATIAERLWSPSEIRDVDDMYRRLEKTSLALEELGLTHEKNRLMLLRRLARRNNTAALEVLVDVIEPLKNYARHRQKPFTVFSPLSRIPDAARPDAPAARMFEKLVDRFLADSNNAAAKDSIRCWLNLWRDNHRAIANLLPTAPALREIESLSKNLAECATIGIESLDHPELKADTLKVDEWIGMLESARAPRAETELAVIPGIKRLVLEKRMN